MPPRVAYHAVHQALEALAFAHTKSDRDGSPAGIVHRDVSTGNIMITAEGDVKKLSDFKGRVVFINFWASWCKPCLANFNKYENTRKQLYTEGVVLLNVSIDEQPPQYRNALNRLNPIGVNGQPIDMKEAKKQYSLYEIPAYYLVDKLGRLVHLSDKQGGDVSEFRKLLAE